MHSSQNTICIEAINLKTQKLSGFKLLTVFSKEVGLIKLSGSKMGGRSEPFVCNRYWVNLKNNADIHSIKHTEFISHYKNINKDLDNLCLSLQLSEFISSCSHFHEERSEQIFELLEECLEKLNEINEQDTSGSFSANLSNYFLWKLSEFLGYKPSLAMCEESSCALRLAKPVEAWFDFEHGGIACSGCGEKPMREFAGILPGIYKYLLQLDSAKSLEELLEENTNDSAANFVKNLVQKYIQKHTERKIKSICL